MSSTYGKVFKLWRMIHTVQDTFFNTLNHKMPSMIVSQQTLDIFVIITVNLGASHSSVGVICKLHQKDDQSL